MKKQEYTTPVIEVNAFAQFENVFTYCNKTHTYAHPQHPNHPNFSCIDITGTGNDGDETGGSSGNNALVGDGSGV